MAVGTQVASLYAKLGVDSTDLNSGLSKAEGSLQRTGGFADGLGGKVAGMGRVMLAGAAVGGAAIVGLGVVSTKAASDVNEAQNKVNVVFGDSAGVINDFAVTSAQDLGTSRGAALETLGTFGNLFVSMGLGQSDAAGLSTKIVTLGSDLASFNNIAPEEALEKLRAGLVGEAEPLRSLGVNMNEAMVKAMGMKMGLADANGELSEGAKVQARYAIIMEQTKTAQGDFANTSTGMANAQRIITAEFKNAQEMIGTQLLPAIAPLISAFAQGLPGAMDTLKPALAGIGETVKKLASGDFKGAFTDMLGTIGEVGGNMATKLVEWGKQLWSWVEPMIPPLLVKLGEMIGKLLGWAGEQVGPLLTKLGEWGEQLWKWIEPKIQPMLDELGKLATKGLAWVGEEGPKLLTKLGEWGEKLWKWVEPKIQPMLDELGKLATKALAWVGEKAPELLTKMGEWGKKLWEWVSPMIPPLLVEAGKLAGGLWTWITTEGPKLAQKFLGEWVPAAIGWVAGAAVDILPKLLGLVASIGWWILTTGVPELVKFGVSMAGGILGGIGEGMGKLAGSLGAWISEQINKIDITLGIFHIKGGSFDVTWPSISAPSVGGGGGGGGGYDSGGNAASDARAREVAWIAADRPDFNAINAGSGGYTAGSGWGENAAGTDSWRGGMTWVGERGPELLDLPRGSRIIPNDRAMAGGGATVVNNFYLSGTYLGDDRAMVQSLARVLKPEIDRVVSGAA